MAASINHPNCVYVFGAYEIDGRPAIALEPMLETLADRLHRDGPLPAAAAVDAALQIARGLAAAAESGILHRDIKPSNCFIGEHGLVKIGDFGISRSLRPAIDTSQVSRFGQVVGTPSLRLPGTAARCTARHAQRHLQPGRDAVRAAHRPHTV